MQNKLICAYRNILKGLKSSLLLSKIPCHCIFILVMSLLWKIPQEWCALSRHCGEWAGPELDEHSLLRFVTWASRLFLRKCADHPRWKVNVCSFFQMHKKILTWSDFLGNTAVYLAPITGLRNRKMLAPVSLRMSAKRLCDFLSALES